MMDSDKKVINILWVDDEPVFGFLLPVEYSEILKKEGFQILPQAYNAKALENLLKKYEHNVDAVITDANMPASDPGSGREDDTSGLTKVLSIMDSLENSGKTIPFYLYTGRDELLDSKFTGGELERFYKDGRFFRKGELKQLFEKIKQDVELISTPEYQIRNKYREEFEAAELIGSKASELLMEELLRIFNNEKKISIDDFNRARRVLERIKNKCSEHKMVPRLSLNSFKSLLKRSYLEEVKLKIDLMPPFLVQEMELFLDFTNNGSHDGNEFQEKLERYIDSNEYVYTYRIVISILMDLLLWYKRLVKEYGSEHMPLYEGSLYEEEASVYLVLDNFYCAKSLTSHRTFCFSKTNMNRQLKEGGIIGIKKSKPKFDSYADNTRPEIDCRYFLYNSGYEIIDECGDNYGK